MEANDHRPAWKTLLAFGIIYIVWGTTFLAIRVGVLQIPPLLLAAMRFGVAGAAMLGWALFQGDSAPKRREWLSVLLIALLIFVFDYGLLFWVEQRVPSGLAAVMLATIPVFMALAEIVFLGTQKLTGRLAFALLIGMCGVAVLVSRSLNLGGEPVEPMGAAALIVAAIGWAIGSALTKKLPLPSSKAISSGAQMFSGGLMLTMVSAGFGEFGRFHPGSVTMSGWFSLAYLIVFGSIIGFTAYVWLIHHDSPTKVGTYAYVNPVVAVIVGYFLGGEPLGMRTVLGAVCVLVSVVVITTAKKPVAVKAVEETA